MQNRGVAAALEGRRVPLRWRDATRRCSDGCQLGNVLYCADNLDVLRLAKKLLGRLLPTRKGSRLSAGPLSAATARISRAGLRGHDHLTSRARLVDRE